MAVSERSRVYAIYKVTAYCVFQNCNLAVEHGYVNFLANAAYFTFIKSSGDTGCKEDTCNNIAYGSANTAEVSLSGPVMLMIPPIACTTTS